MPNFPCSRERPNVAPPDDNMDYEYEALVTLEARLSYPVHPSLTNPKASFTHANENNRVNPDRDIIDVAKRSPSRQRRSPVRNTNQARSEH